MTSMLNYSNLFMAPPSAFDADPAAGPHVRADDGAEAMHRLRNPFGTDRAQTAGRSGTPRADESSR